ncbi:MAG: hypothetical protein JSS75_01670 [Bacteroidetes bacterium]|nr:hypothetical protein [Bacteroidota bacterium]
MKCHERRGERQSLTISRAIDSIDEGLYRLRSNDHADVILSEAKNPLMKPCKAPPQGFFAEFTLSKANVLRMTV